jgi:hypothetical protein
MNDSHRMKTIFWTSISTLALVALLLIGPKWPASASLATSPLASDATAAETWRLGITIEGTVVYQDTIGRAVSDVAAFRSNRDVADVYYVFPAAGSSRTVATAQTYLLSRSGTYSGAATLSLEILAFDGTLQHTVSAAPIDVQVADTGLWADLTLSTIADDVLLEPGEFLAFHFQLEGAPGGDLDARYLLEVGLE